jgi:hypothetical protein
MRPSHSHRATRSLLVVTLATALVSACDPGTSALEPTPATPETSLTEAPLPLTANFSGHDYLFIRSAKTWGEASSICESLGYGLVTVNDSQEQTWLHGFGSSHSWWLGYNDVQSEGSWRWSHGTSSYTNWGSLQPDNYNNEDCAHFMPNGAWNDLPCSSQLYFICESLE